MARRPFSTTKRVATGSLSQAPAISVSQLTVLIKQSLESHFSSQWVAGELSDVARPQSGHIYLTLKDQNAQIRGVIWRSVATTLKFELRDGMQVVCFGDIDVYPPRGVYQLVIRRVSPLLALWGPFVAFSALILWMYWRIAYVPGGQPIGALERFADNLGKWGRKLAARFNRNQIAKT